MKSDIRNNKETKCITGKRSTFLFCIIMLGLGLSCFEIALINIRQESSASAGVSTSKTLVLGESRGIIYDCNMNRLVCTEYKKTAAVKPSITALSTLKDAVSTEEYVLAVEEISKGNPILLHPEYLINDNEIITEKIYRRYNESQLAVHLIGHLENGNKSGAAGIELSCNDIISKYSGSLKCRFFTNGAGLVMQGEKIEKIDENYNSEGGVVLTLNREIQLILENAMDECSLEKGAAVMLDVETGAVVAAVSRPSFDPNNVADYIDDADLALFNRILGTYPVGSVFKPLVAAAALEQGIDPAVEYECTGSISENSATFGCTKSHGIVNMASALAYSCNCYFVNLTDKLDCSRVLDLAESLGFGGQIELADSIFAYSSDLPSAIELTSFSARANFSFGQGNVTASPVQMAILYSMIANSGEYRAPYLVEGVCDENGNFTRTHTLAPPYKVISADTADTLGACLELAAREGTGKNACANGVTVAGKTATAQSGEYSGGKERLVTWFAGYFPYETPKYALVLMCEDGESGSEDCAPVFSLVAGRTSEYEHLIK